MQTQPTAARDRTATNPLTWPYYFLVDRCEASRWFRAHGVSIAPATLARWAYSRDDGPPYQRCGRSCVYTLRSLRSWLAAQLEGA